MKIETDVKLDFQDVLLKPKKSTLSSRNDVELERTMIFPYSKYTWTGIPIMVSNMDTTGIPEMYKEISKYKMITVFHKYVNVKDIEEFDTKYYSLSTGISEKDYNKLKEDYIYLKEKGKNVYFICIDIANGYINKLIDYCKKIRNSFPEVILIAGNVVSHEMVQELIWNGKVDIVKVGIGSGSVCTTRLQTGVGMPQFSAVMDCTETAHGCNGHIISDGGIVHPGDIGKAFGGGADFVMMGSMFAGHTESAGEIEVENGKKYRVFYGMSSETAMKKYHGGIAKYRSSEGKTVKIKYKGNVSETVQSILGGLRSTCTYIGAQQLKDINDCATFIKVNHIVNKKYE